MSEQQSAVTELDFLRAEVKKVESIYQQKLTALAELKQSLLQKAFSGELTAGNDASDAIREEEEVA
jgi:type I restriction enzyme, S subunit